MKKEQLRQAVEEFLSDSRYRSNLDELGERIRFAAMVQNELDALKESGEYPKSKYNYGRTNYTHYRVTQMLGLGEMDRLGDMRPNEIVAWGNLLQASHKDLIEAGAGAGVLPIREILQLLKHDDLGDGELLLDVNAAA